MKSKKGVDRNDDPSKHRLAPPRFKESDWKALVEKRADQLARDVCDDMKSAMKLSHLTSIAQTIPTGFTVRPCNQPPDLSKVKPWRWK